MNSLKVPQAHSPTKSDPNLLTVVSRSDLASPRILMVFVCLLLIFAGAAQPITDTDFWWHLRTGQYIVETRSIPHTDIFSSIKFGSEWIAHEWLSEVAMFAIWKLTGFIGLIASFALIVTAAFVILYRRCVVRSVHPYVALFAVLFGAVASISTWGVRPHIFSVLFASSSIAVLESFARREMGIAIWWLVPLIVIWTNAHAGFVIGLALIALSIVGLLADRLLLSEERHADDWKRVWTLVFLLAACIAVVVFNPNGTRLFTYPLETLTSPAMMRYIEEWRSPNFHELRFQGLLLLLIATFSALVLSKNKIRPRDLIMLAATTWATLRSARNVWLFVLVAVPLFAEAFSSFIWTYFPLRASDLAEQRKSGAAARGQAYANATILLLCVILVGLGVRRAANRQPIVEAEQFPINAIEFLKSERLAQPQYNEYEWGGYLIWKLYPQYKVYIDGRADVYGNKQLEVFFNVHEGNLGWRDVLDRDNIRTVFVRPSIPLASLLRSNEDSWEKVFEDKQAVIFRRR